MSEEESPRRRVADRTIAATAPAHGAPLVSDVSDDKTLCRPVSEVVQPRSSEVPRR